MTANHTKCNQKQPEVSTFCNLTEQWKKGELEFGKEYYVRFEDGEISTAQWCYYTNQDRYGFDVDEVKEALAPVPSYEEWQELQEYKRIVTSYNMKPIDYDIACETVNKLLDEKEKLRNELGLLKESIGKDCGTHYINLFLQENQQLKELLKEVRDAWVIYKPYDRHQLCKRIDNAIGEKK